MGKGKKKKMMEGMPTKEEFEAMTEEEKKAFKAEMGEKKGRGKNKGSKKNKKFDMEEFEAMTEEEQQAFKEQRVAEFENRQLEKFGMTKEEFGALAPEEKAELKAEF